MALIGFHASIAGSIEKSIDRARQLEVDSFQIFLGSPRIWAYSDLLQKNIDLFKKKRVESRFDQIVAHLSYLANPSSSDKLIREKSLKAMIEEINRADLLGIDHLVFHIGSHKGAGLEIGIQNVINTIDHLITLEPKVNLLLETSAGTRNSVGSEFEEIGRIIEGVSDRQKIAVCLDTCHIFAAGYDIRSIETVEKTLKEFDHHIGLDKIKVIHANDSKTEINSGKDRHEHIGLGNIGIQGFESLLNHNIFKNTPVIIETPNDEIRDDRENLDILRNLIKN